MFPSPEAISKAYSSKENIEIVLEIVPSYPMWRLASSPTDWARRPQKPVRGDACNPVAEAWYCGHSGSSQKMMENYRKNIKILNEKRCFICQGCKRTFGRNGVRTWKKHRRSKCGHGFRGWIYTGYGECNELRIIQKWLIKGGKQNLTGMRGAQSTDVGSGHLMWLE
jgi:hypothetical protein